MGAKITLDHGYIDVECKRLRGASTISQQTAKNSSGQRSAAPSFANTASTCSADRTCRTAPPASRRSRALSNASFFPAPMIRSFVAARPAKQFAGPARQAREVQRWHGPPAR